MPFYTPEQADVQRQEDEVSRLEALAAYQRCLAQIEADHKAELAREGVAEWEPEATAILLRHMALEGTYFRLGAQEEPQPQYQPSPYQQNSYRNSYRQAESVHQERPESEAVLLPEARGQWQEPQAREEGPHLAYGPNEHVPVPGPYYQQDDDSEDDDYEVDHSEVNYYAGDHYEGDDYEDDDYEDDDYEGECSEDDSGGYGQYHQHHQQQHHQQQYQKQQYPEQQDPQQQQHDTYYQGDQRYRGGYY